MTDGCLKKITGRFEKSTERILESPRELLKSLENFEQVSKDLKNS